MSTCEQTFGDYGLPMPIAGHHRIRFAPPLVISEEDLMKAVRVIECSLKDLDTVCAVYCVTRGMGC
jgi:acetylornithine/succinyldiaminopimelate/putrescine aminotransferase